MAITYDAPSNTITVTGYTEGTPCTFLDIWNADQAGGWGVVSKQGDVQFLFDCKLQIGDGSTETWFADTNKEIVFSDSAAPVKWDNLFRFKANSNFRLGTLVDATDKITKDGCAIIVATQTQGQYRLFIGDLGLDEVELYSSTFYNGKYIACSGDWKIYNCIFDTFGIGFQFGTPYFYNVLFYDCWIGNMIPTQVEKLHIFSVSKAFYTRGAYYIDIQNVIVRDVTTLAEIADADCHFVNVDSNTWGLTWWAPPTPGKLYRQYEFDLTVRDKKTKSSINGATVTMWDKDGNQIFSVTTDTDGKITTQTVTYKLYEDDGTGSTVETAFSPFHLRIEKTGYQTYDDYGIELDKKTELEIGLNKAVGIFLDFGRPVVNLKKADPENKNIMVL